MVKIAEGVFFGALTVAALLASTKLAGWIRLSDKKFGYTAGVLIGTAAGLMAYDAVQHPGNRTPFAAAVITCLTVASILAFLSAHNLVKSQTACWVIVSPLVAGLGLFVLVKVKESLRL